MSWPGRQPASAGEPYALGDSLCEAIQTVRAWAYTHIDELTAARQAYQRDNP
jgi:DNA-binding HxlR family transcriptional regulator